MNLCPCNKVALDGSALLLCRELNTLAMFQTGQAEKTHRCQAANIPLVFPRCRNEESYTNTGSSVLYSLNWNVIPSSHPTLTGVQQIFWHSFEFYSFSLTELNWKCHNSPLISAENVAYVWFSHRRRSLSELKWMAALIHIFCQLSQQSSTLHHCNSLSGVNNCKSWKVCLLLWLLLCIQWYVITADTVRPRNIKRWHTATALTVCTLDRLSRC